MINHDHMNGQFYYTSEIIRSDNFDYVSKILRSVNFDYGWESSIFDIPKLLIQDYWCKFV